jgi:UDP-glucose:(heptosyl)LPS alpha-1,3-glucosyltransferase
MKIALIHMRHSHTGGTERYMNQTAAYLAARGDDVTIVCRSHEEAPHPAVRFVRLRRPVPGSIMRMWAFARDVERHVAAGVYDVVYALGRTWTHDVIRLGGGCHQTYLEQAHAATRAPWERWTGRDLLKQRVALALESRGLAPGAFRRVIVNSEMVKRDIIQRHRVPPERIDVIYNGVDLERFHPERHRLQASDLRRTCGFASSDAVVLFLGTGYGRKGLGVLLSAFAMLASRTPEVRLLVVGYDSAQSSYERTAARLGIADKTRFLGGRRDAEICYAAADIYALPTLYDPFANATLEALASGLPVITTAANGAHEILGHHETGSILDANRSAEALASELLFWSRRRDASLAARQLAEKFSVERMAAETATVLDRIARRSPRT